MKIADVKWILRCEGAHIAHVVFRAGKLKKLRGGCCKHYADEPHFPAPESTQECQACRQALNRALAQK